jgi:hypothetical protein
MREPVHNCEFKQPQSSSDSRLRVLYSMTGKRQDTGLVAISGPDSLQGGHL